MARPRLRALPGGPQYLAILSANSHRVARRALTPLQWFVMHSRPMRLSTWLIMGLSAAYIVDMLYFGGIYSMAAATLFRHVGLGVLAGFRQYV